MKTISSRLPGSAHESELKIRSDLYHQALDLRYELFFRGHNLPREILIDEYEEASKHIVIVDDESLIAYGRLTDLGEGIYRLSQIVVKPQEQGKGYGSMILKALVERVKNDGGKKIILNASTTATALYEKHGFRSNGEVFLSKSTGVPHVQMFYTTSGI
jgi:predicted GNAT family N-acyltransferase